MKANREIDSGEYCIAICLLSKPAYAVDFTHGLITGTQNINLYSLLMNLYIPAVKKCLPSIILKIFSDPWQYNHPITPTVHRLFYILQAHCSAQTKDKPGLMDNNLLVKLTALEVLAPYLLVELTGVMSCLWRAASLWQSVDSHL